MIRITEDFSYVKTQTCASFWYGDNVMFNIYFDPQVPSTQIYLLGADEKSSCISGDLETIIQKYRALEFEEAVEEVCKLIKLKQYLFPKITKKLRKIDI